MMETAEEYYERMTEKCYLRIWNPDHIHFGLFEPGERVPLDRQFDGHHGEAIHLRACQRMIDVTVAPAQIQADHHVVDAGCGVGGTAIRLAQLHGCRVTGVNISRLQLDLCQKKVNDAGLADRIKCEYADCSVHLPFEDSSVDVVVNIESACHYADRFQFLQEVRRILKKGGRIAAQDWMACDNLAPGLYEKYIQPMCDLTAIPGLDNPSSYKTKLENAGLKVLEFQGFDGMEMGNVEILGHLYEQLFGLYLAGADNSEFLDFMKWISSLHSAWKLGHFEIQRYCAEL